MDEPKKDQSNNIPTNKEHDYKLDQKDLEKLKIISENESNLYLEREQIIKSLINISHQIYSMASSISKRTTLSPKGRSQGGNVSQPLEHR